MKLPFSNLITTVQEARAQVQLTDAWKIGTATFDDLNYRRATKDAYKKNALVYACIREIATSVSEAPFQVTREVNSVISAVPDHPAHRWLDNPNPVMSSTEWWEALLTIEHIAGNAWVLKDEDTESLWILRPDWMQIIPLRNGRRRYKYGPAGQEVFLEQDEIIHFPYGVDPLDIYGFAQGPLEAIWRDIATDNSATDFFKVFFDNSAVPSGIIKVKRRLARQSEVNRIQRQWMRRYSGPEGWHTPAVMDEDAEYQKIGLTLEELRMDTLRHVTESRICMGFGVPPIIVGANVGLQRSTYSNYREARSTFWEETLAPMYKRHAQIIKKDLVDDFPNGALFETRFDLAKVVALQQNRIEQVEAYTPALAAGGLTVNQFLTLIGLNPVPGGDRYVNNDSEGTNATAQNTRSYHDSLLESMAQETPELRELLDHGKTQSRKVEA